MVRSTEIEGGFNFEPTLEISGNSTNLEFHKGKGTYRGSRNRTALGKPTPSKWDDAQKWLVGLSSRVGDRGQAMTKPRNSNADDRRLITHVPQKEKDSSSSSAEEGIPTTKIQDEGEGEMKKVDCNETFWRINKPSEDSSSLAILSVCVRDMGTEMTPIASQEPSRTGTPLRATTPACRSPISSRFYSPERCHQTGQTSFENKSEDMVVSRAGGATKWSNLEDEESKSCKIHENKKSEQTRTPNPLETRAMAWDEAECAKYMARYKREEVKIQAWENHQKIKAEMEMRRMEVKAERLKSRAQEKLVNKLASTRRIAEERRANAEAKLTEQAVRTSEKADYIRRTGHLPSTFSFKLPSLCW